MHYYQFNIADYRKDTGHLTPVEHYIYRWLIDEYHLSEQPFNNNVTKLLRRMSLDESHRSSLELILEEFFVPACDDDYEPVNIDEHPEYADVGERPEICQYWVHRRMDQDVDTYRKFIENKSAAGKASAESRKIKKNNSSTTVKQQPTGEQLTKNYKPLTTNQEPLTKDQNLEPKVDKKDVYPDEFEEAWKQYPKRSGANPKRKAFSAFKARLKNKTDQKAIFDGVIRYSKYVLETGKASTEFVMQMATFLGPDEHYLNEWAIPTQKPDEIKPRNDTDWQALGRKIALNANPGESMNDYIRRIQIKIKEHQDG